ncbi:MAG: HEAT repeat domain-containing protein, partial [Planctomycetota bacterium]
MDCEDAKTAISDRLSGVLDQDASAALDRHLAGCPACREVLQEFEAVDEFIRREHDRGPSAGEGARKGLEIINSRGPATPPPRKAAFPVWLAPLGMAAAVVLLLLVVQRSDFLHRKPEPADPPHVENDSASGEKKTPQPGTKLKGEKSPVVGGEETASSDSEKPPEIPGEPPTRAPVPDPSEADKTKTETPGAPPAAPGPSETPVPTPMPLPGDEGVDRPTPETPTPATPTPPKPTTPTPPVPAPTSGAGPARPPLPSSPPRTAPAPTPTPTPTPTPGPAPTPTPMPGGGSPGKKRAARERASSPESLTSGGLEKVEEYWQAQLPALILGNTRSEAPAPSEEARENILALLEKGLEGKQWFHRGAALHALARSGGASPDLEPFIQDEAEELRPDVAASLGYFDGKNSVRVLAEYLLDAGRSAELRSSSAISLGLRKAESSYLANALDLGGDPRVRGACLAGLFLLGTPPAQVILGRVAANDSERHEIRALALGFLGKSGGGAGSFSERALTTALEDRKGPLPLRRAAAIGLWHFPSASTSLMNAALHDPSVMLRPFAWVSLGRMAPSLSERNRAKLFTRMRR